MFWDIFKKKKKEDDFIWLPYTQMKNHLPQLEVESTKGVEIFLKNGDVLIDGISSWWSVSNGYNHPKIVEAIKKQVEKLPHIMLAGFKNEQTYKLAKRLCEFSKMDRVFFSDSGSTAIEVAMKIAWQYFMNKNQKEKTKFIAFKNSYHGDTSGAMSLADLESGMHQKFNGILIDNFSLELPRNAEDLKEFEEFLEANHQILAGIFIEPLVQCAGGMKFCEPKILANIYKLAKKYKILFIADECAVGFYRTGKKLACNHAKITPDILILGKALTGGFVTLAATLVKEEIFNAFLGDSLDMALMHGPTFMGNPLACSAANASLDIYESENYEKKIAKDEKYLKEKLEKFKKFKKVKDVRIIGLLAAIEIDLSWDKILEIRQEFIKEGVFLRPFANVIYLMPALNIERKYLEKIILTIEKILTKLDEEN